MNLIQIPAMGCDDGLYHTFDGFLPASVKPHTHVIAQGAMGQGVAALRAEMPERCVLLGTSFGARLAMETTLAAPARVKGLVIIGSGPGPVVDQAAGLRRSARIRGGEFENVLQEMGDIISHLPGPRGAETMHAFRAMARTLGPETFALQSDAMAHRIDLWPRMAEITCPVLCLWGANDQFSPAETAHKIAAAVPQGASTILPNCGHFPTLEYPEETASAFLKWADMNGLNKNR